MSLEQNKEQEVKAVKGWATIINGKIDVDSVGSDRLSDGDTQCEMEVLITPVKQTYKARVGIEPEYDCHDMDIANLQKKIDYLEQALAVAEEGLMDFYDQSDYPDKALKVLNRIKEIKEKNI